MKQKVKFFRRKIEIPTPRGGVVRFYSDLMYVKYEDPYCWLYFVNGEKFKADITLKDLLKGLPAQPFFQSSRKVIVNLCFYTDYYDKPGAIIMQDGETLELSVRNLPHFHKQKNSLKRISTPCQPCLCCESETCSDHRLFCLTNDQLNEKNRTSK